MAAKRLQLTSEPAFRALADYHEKNGKQINIRQLFKQDTNRFQNYRFVFMGIPKQRMVYVLTFGQHLQGQLSNRVRNFKRKSMFIGKGSYIT